MSIRLPLHLAIVEILKREKTVTDAELLKALKKVYGNVTTSMLNKALMKLEIRGLIHVSSLSKIGKQIEFIGRESGR
jgi:arginine repressor